MLALMGERTPRLSRPKSCPSDLSILDSPRSRYLLIPMVDPNLSLKTNPACSHFLLQAYGSDPTLRLQRKFTRLSRQLNVSEAKKAINLQKGYGGRFTCFVQDLCFNIIEGVLSNVGNFKDRNSTY